jgi:hypothetical protein
MPRVPNPKPLDPGKAIFAAPRLKPIESRNYGKGMTPLGSGPTPFKFGPPIKVTP